MLSRPEMRRRSLASACALVALAALPAAAHAAGSGHSILLFSSNRTAGDLDIYSARPDGSGRVDLTRTPGNDFEPQLSPDGRRIVFASERGGSRQIWVMHVDGTRPRQLTTITGEYPGWADGGRLIVFESDHAGNRDIYRMNADGSQVVDLTADDPSWDGAAAPQPHGDLIVFDSNRADGVFHNYTMRLDGSQVTQLAPAAPYQQAGASWSPDGTRLSFNDFDAQGGHNDIWTVNLDGSNLRQLTDTPDRAEFRSAWSPNGRKIVFDSCTAPRTPDQHCELYEMPSAGGPEVDVTTTPSLSDSLSDNWQDPFWSIGGFGTGGHSAEVNGRLEQTLDADVTFDPTYNTVSTNYSGACELEGNFDVRASYTLLSWPLPANGVTANLSLYSPDAGAIGAVQRESDPWNEGYSSYFVSGGASAPSMDQSGRLRLVRTGSIATAYYRATHRWVEVGSAIVPTAGAWPNLGLLTFGDGRFAHQQVRIAWSDFSATADALACPDWWQDVGPSWGEAAR
jgi:TolB protein